MKDENLKPARRPRGEHPSADFGWRNFLKIPSAGHVIYRLPWYFGCICVIFSFVGAFHYPYDYISTSCLLYSVILCTIFFAVRGTNWKYIPLVIIPLVFCGIGLWKANGDDGLALMLFTIICFFTIGMQQGKRKDIPGLVLLFFFLIILIGSGTNLLNKVEGHVLWPFGSIAPLQ